MWSKTSPLLSSLTAKCIKQCCTNQNGVETQRLPIHMRQAIIDYLVRERISVGSKFVCDLLQGGGVYSFDLWSLADNNLYKPNEVSSILDTLASNCGSLTELVLGGSSWIYNGSVIKGPLRQLFQQQLPKLKVLRIQQISCPDELVAICQACQNLVKLDICQPSVTDTDINRIEETLQGSTCSSIRTSLKELRLPSTVRNSGILKCLSIFQNVQWFKAARFEAMLESLDRADQWNACDWKQHTEQARRTLHNLRGLTISHPLGYETVDVIVDASPFLEELSLEVQDGMRLSPIARLASLRRLELRNSANTPTSYLQEVQPLLECIGQNLESLSLELFDVVDLAVAARLCPNLNALSAQWFTILSCNRGPTSVSLSRQEKEAMKRSFQNLRYLRLRPRTQRQVGAEAVDFLLTHAHHLEHCELYCCLDLTDDHIKLIVQSNGFRHLKHLILRHGYSVTPSTLNLLTTKSENLQYIDCGRLLSKAELVPDPDANPLNVP
ncbi:hypothetical protein HDE_08372 [Halotydeus destructor]|nr:hypothetical protein HDE_08372 [Halotydeus destructor]